MPENNIIAYQALEIIFGDTFMRVYRPTDINDQDTTRIFLNRDDVFYALSTTETFSALDSVEDVELVTNINESGMFEKTSAVCLRDLYQQAIVHKKNNQLFVNFFEYLKFDKSELFSNFLRDYCENPDVEFFGFDKAEDGGDVSASVSSSPDGFKVLAKLSEMTQEQKEEFVSQFNGFKNMGKIEFPTFDWASLKNSFDRKEKPPATSVYLRNGKPVIKSSTLSILLGWNHNSIIAEIKRWVTNCESAHFFETDNPLLIDYEVTRIGYQILVDDFGISNQTQANNEDAICAAFDVFENISDMGVSLSQPEEIALAVEIIEDLMQKYVGHLTIYAALTEYNQDPVKFQHHQRLLNIFHLSFMDGCLFIADRCPLVDYDLLHWHPDSITNIPHDFGTIRPSIMIRLFDSTIDSDIPY